MHRVFEALGAGVLNLHPAASACCCCSGMVTVIVNSTTPNNPTAATMAITAIDVVVFCERSLLLSLSIAIDNHVHKYNNDLICCYRII